MNMVFGGWEPIDKIIADHRTRNWGMVLVGAGLSFWMLSGLLMANKYFPQGVVGTAGDVRAVTIIELVADFRQDGVERATGILRFFDPSGNSTQVRVTGEGLQGVVLSELAFVVGAPGGKFKLRYELDSLSGQQEVFWVEILEQSGSVSGKIQYDLYEGSQLSTSVPVPSVEALTVNTLSVQLTGALKTGVAIANPGNQTVEYWLVAQGSQQELVELSKRTLPRKGQTAMFVNDFFPGLQAGFDGFLSVVSSRELAVLGLEQNRLELSTATNLPPLHLPFVAGRLEDYLKRDVNNGEDYLVSDATLTVTKGSTIQTGTVSPGGNYLIGPLSDGEWLVRVDAPGFLAFEQPFELPRIPDTLEITNLSFVNPQWLSSTLATNTSFQGTVVKPDRALNFFFDLEEEPQDSLTDFLRKTFKQWVVVQLPQLGIPVEDELGEEVFLGGKSRYQEVETPPSAGSESTVILTPNLSLSSAAKATVFVQTVDTTSSGSVFAVSSGKGMMFAQPEATVNRVIRAALLEYNPDRLAELGSEAEGIARVARTFWAAVFLRTEAVANLGTFAVSGLAGETEKLTSIHTIMTRSAQTFVSTPYDAFYWEMLKKRPTGTLISEDSEILPKQ